MKNRILITTGIYPPKFGGPAQYAKRLKEALEKKGNAVHVKTFDIEDRLPTGIRHIYFFFKILPSFLSSRAAFTLDTWSVGFPTVLAGRIFGKKVIIRTGGDFLWEWYVERTKRSVLLRDFYDREKDNFSGKEKVVFRVTRFTLLNASHVIFSTEWQRDIFIKAYGLPMERTSIVENFYGPKESDEEYASKTFVGSARPLVWKNLDALRRIFDTASIRGKNAELFSENLPFERFMEKIRTSYAVILVSLGDISPNMILDAIRFNRPFICTKEVGIYPRIKDAGIFVDPLNEREIEAAILRLLEPEEYQAAKNRVRSFSFIHTWDDIADAFLKTLNSLA